MLNGRILAKNDTITFEALKTAIIRESKIETRLTNGGDHANRDCNVPFHDTLQF